MTEQSTNIIISNLADQELLDNAVDLLEAHDEKMKNMQLEIDAQRQELENFRIGEEYRLEFIESSLKKQLERYNALLAESLMLKETIGGVVSELVRLNKNKRKLEELTKLIHKIQLIDVFIERTEKLIVDQKFSELSQVLLGCFQLTDELRPFIENTVNIKKKVYRVDEMKQVLWNSIIGLFKSFAGARGAGFRPNKSEILKLAEAALVIDVLGSKYRKMLIDWYVEGQLKDYKDLFRGNLEMASLSKLTNRFYWLQRLYSTFADEHEIIFMPRWNVKLELTIHFCVATSKDIADMLRLNEGKLNAGDMWESIREVKAFESSLMAIFPNAERSALCISHVFEGHMELFVKVQELEFSRFIGSLPLKLEPGDIDSGYLIASAPKFFLLIRDAWEDTSALDSYQTTIELVALMNKFLSDYSRYLQERLPKRLSMGKTLKTSDVKLVCTLLSTASYCIETTEGLNYAVQAIPEVKMALDASIQSFHVLSSLCMSQLDMHTELLLQDSWNEMSNILKLSWNCKSQVGDQSGYVPKMQSCISSILLQVRNYISRPSTLDLLAGKITKMLLERIKETIFDCRPISTTGAQQLLVDLAGLRNGLAELSNLKGRRADSRLSTEMNDGLTVIEGIIKTVLLPVSPAKTFVEGYLLLVGDPSHAVFSQIIGLKSITKQEIAALEHEFDTIVPPAPSGPIQTAPGNRLTISAARRPSAPSTADQVLYRADQMLNKLQHFKIEEHVKKLLLVSKNDTEHVDAR